MANLSCPRCGQWLADVGDASWRVRSKASGVSIKTLLETSSDLWSNFEVVDKRADEWRDRGVYDPLPPPPDPVNAAVTLACPCGETVRFNRP